MQRRQFLILILMFVISSTTIQNSAVSVHDEAFIDKTAVIGNNYGNISSNQPSGGQFLFNLTTVPGETYSFSLTGDAGTKFDVTLYNTTSYLDLGGFFPVSYKYYAEVGSYPVGISSFTCEYPWLMIQVFSNAIDGGLGDFVLNIEGESSVSSGNVLIGPSNLKIQNNLKIMADHLTNKGYSVNQIDDMPTVTDLVGVDIYLNFGHALPPYSADTISMFYDWVEDGGNVIMSGNSNGLNFGVQLKGSEETYGATSNYWGNNTVVQEDHPLTNGIHNISITEGSVIVDLLPVGSGKIIGTTSVDSTTPNVTVLAVNEVGKGKVLAINAGLLDWRIVEGDNLLLLDNFLDWANTSTSVTNELTPINITLPQANQYIDGNVVVNWTKSTDLWDRYIVNYELSYLSVDGDFHNLIVSNLTSTTYVWDTSSVPDGSYDLHVYASSEAGAASDSVSINIGPEPTNNTPSNTQTDDTTSDGGGLAELPLPFQPMVLAIVVGTLLVVRRKRIIT